MTEEAKIEDRIHRAENLIAQQEAILAQKNMQLSKLESENANLRTALDRRENSRCMLDADTAAKYRMAAHKAYGDNEHVTVADDAEVIVEVDGGAYVAAWVAVSAVQAGVEVDEERTGEAPNA